MRWLKNIFLISKSCTAFLFNSPSILTPFSWEFPWLCVQEIGTNLDSLSRIEFKLLIDLKRLMTFSFTSIAYLIINKTVWAQKGQSFFRLSMGFKIIFLQGVIHFLPELKSCLILRLFSTGVSTGADLALRQGCLKWIAASYSSRVLYKIKEIQET